jgi:hypothetical protein
MQRRLVVMAVMAALLSAVGLLTPRANVPDMCKIYG